MRHAHLDLAMRGIRFGILTFAVSLQMLPFFFLLLVFAYYMGATGAGMLVTVPLFLMSSFVAACWLTARQMRRRTPAAPADQPIDRHATPAPKPRRPVDEGAMLLKTREERYRDMLRIFTNSRR